MLIRPAEKYSDLRRRGHHRSRNVEISRKRLQVPVSVTLEPAPLPRTQAPPNSPSESDPNVSNPSDAAQSQ